MGTMDKIKEPLRLATCPKCSTTIWPRKLERVAPRPKLEAVRPTADGANKSNRVRMPEYKELQAHERHHRYLLTTLNRPVPKVMSATR